jgi:hypothetical protein
MFNRPAPQTAFLKTDPHTTNSSRQGVLEQTALFIKEAKSKFVKTEPKKIKMMLTKPFPV